MADEGKPPAGRGSSGPGRGGQRKTKFAPTVPSQRRRRTDEGAGAAGASATAAEAAAANEAFQDLIRAAQTESKWQRGRGRGFGRGRGPAATTVMFGGDGSSDGRRTAAAPQPRAAPKPKGESKPGVKADGAASSKRRLKPNAAKPEDGAAAADGAGTSSKPRRHHADSSDGSDSEGAQELSSLFDYEQYFPTTLPLPLHHPCDEEADAFGDAAVMRHGLPEELALREDDPEGDTATQLGLTDLSTAADTLYLFQLPSLLPLGLPPAPPAAAADGRKGRGAAAAAAAAAAAGGGGPSSSAAAAAAAAAAAGSSRHQLRAAGARELPSGPIGKLLVFKSGRVKLQVGSCLLDVSAGMPVVSRQDVAAINKSTGHLIQLGPVTQRAVVCPDVWQLMANQEVPEFRRDLQQQPQGLTNGFGGGEGAMEVDGDEDLEDEGVVVAGAGRVKQQQQVLGSEEEESEEDEGSEQQQGVKAEQQQDKQQQQQQPKRVVQQLDSSSEDGSPEPAAAAAGDVKQEPTAAAAAGVPPRQPAAQQQQQPAGNGALGWLELPAARAPAAGRGRGKFRPTTRSPSPGAAAMAASAAAAAGSGGVKHEDAMDVDS